MLWCLWSNSKRRYLDSILILMWYSLAQYLISMTLGLKWRHQSHLLSWSWTSEEHRKSGNRASSSSSTGFEYIAALQYSALWEVTKYRNNGTVKLKPATLLKAQLGACPTKAHLRFELWFGYLDPENRYFWHSTSCLNPMIFVGPQTLFAWDLHS